jgi:hypothetical protein
MENAHISNVICDLQDIVDDFDRDKLGTSKLAKSLKRLADRWNELAEELLTLPKKLKVGEKKDEKVLS